MRSWESARPPKKVGLGPDSQDRMDQVREHGTKRLILSERKEKRLPIICRHGLRRWIEIEGQQINFRRFASRGIWPCHFDFLEVLAGYGAQFGIGPAQ